MTQFVGQIEPGSVLPQSALVTNPTTPMAPDGIQFLNPLEIPDWDAAAGSLPEASFFHSVAWTRVLVTAYGYRPIYVTNVAGGRVRAILPLMEVSSWLTGRRGVSLPFTDHVHPLCPDAESFRMLFEAARKWAHEKKWKYLECRGGRTWLPEASASTSFLSHKLDLEADPTAIFKRFDDSVRRAIRKSEKGELKVEFSQSIDAMKAYYDLHINTRKRHGVPPQPFSFFESIQRHVLADGKGWIVLIRQGDRPIASAVFFHFGRTAIYKFGASDDNFQQLRPNNLVMWQAIQHYAKQGLKVFDFGRTSLANEGLRRFKLSWGTREEQIEYINYDCRKRGYVTAPDETAGWHTRVFNALPVNVSRLIGSVLYRHVG